MTDFVTILGYTTQFVECVRLHYVVSWILFICLLIVNTLHFNSCAIFPTDGAAACWELGSLVSDE